ncbi:MAG: hypothetical protein K2L34_05225 [Muribaculaceae bacterium]|nr:hypothetical protein [Muribaculaceae bacterium]
MKLNIFKSALFLLAIAIFGSCSEGKYWDEPSNPGNVYAFVKPAETISVPTDGDFPSTVNVTVSRNSSVGNVSVPVVFKSNSELITGPATVEFADGSLTSTYVISLGDGLEIGVDYTANLSLEQPKDVLLQVNSKNLSYAFKISKALSWVSAGKAAVFSDWGGNEEAAEIAVEIASNYPSSELRLCRLVNPYKTLDPDYTSDAANLEFFITNDGNAAGMRYNWQYIGQYDEENGYYFFGISEANGGSFTNEGDEYIMNGFMAYGATASKPDGIGWYETLSFTWIPPAK